MTARVARCPHCATTFKVVADQLRLRAGWVRCGVCGQVFDARDPQTLPEVAPMAAAEAVADTELPAIFHVPEERTRRAPANWPREPFFDFPSGERDAVEGFDTHAELRGHGRVDRGYGAAATGLPPLLRRGRQSAFWRACWSVALLVTVLALLGQALWWWRTPIATYAPLTRPALERTCAVLGCTVGYVRKPRQLSIESSSVQPRTGQAQEDGAEQPLVLSALLRNRAPHAQPWPALELSLTDYSDTVVMRRALMPEDYLGADVAARPFAAHSEQHVTVEFTARGIPVSGYRVTPFFP